MKTKTRSPQIQAKTNKHDDEFEEIIKKLDALEKQLDSVIKIFELVGEFVENCCSCQSKKHEEQKASR